MRSRANDVALCRHQQERERGGVVLTVLGPPEALAARLDVRLLTPGTRGGRPLAFCVVPKLEPLFERKSSAAAKLGDLRPGQFVVVQDATIAEIERTPSLLITEPVPEAEILQRGKPKAGAVTNEPCPAGVRT